MSLTVAKAKPPDGAEPTLPATAGAVRREILRRFDGEGHLDPDRAIMLDGVPARRLEGAAKGRAIAVVVAVHAGYSWNLTLSGPVERFTTKALEDAVSSWRWDP